MIELAKFKDALYQLVRPNRFFVYVTPPSIYDHGMENPELLVYLAQGASIPAKTIGQIELKHHGMSLFLPGDASHEDLSLTFFNHYGWEPRDFFEGWIEIMQAVQSDNSRTDGIDMIIDSGLEVHQIGDTEDDILAIYKFYDVFPKNVSSIELSMESNDAVETFTVDFAYSHWAQGEDE